MSDDVEHQHHKPKKSFVKYGKHIRASATVSQGNKRKTMEDRICISNFKYKDKIYSVFLLLDGHGGSDVADLVSKNFTSVMFGFIKQYNGKHIRRVIKDTFLEINRQVSKHDSGTTASLLLAIEENGKEEKNEKTESDKPDKPDKKDVKKSRKSKTRPDIWVANVGDSTVYGIDYEHGARKLTVDHNVSVKAEHARIVQDGSLQINDGYVVTPDGHGLAVTRALGDSAFGSIVTAEPHIVHVRYPFPLFSLASDGLWDVVKGNEVWKRLNPPRERRAWRDSAYRINQWRNETFAQHDNSSLILVYINE